jgi:lysine-N-methylase
VDEAERKGGRPTYAGAFECIGPECEDSCCGTWDIPLDKRTYERYAMFPVERLGGTVAKHVSVKAGAPEAMFAQIHRTANGCPFWGADRLCRIQREYGAGMLSATCSSYPRTLNRVDGVLEGSLMLSCPEAARNVLLDPDAMEVSGELEAGGFRTDNFFVLASNANGGPHKPYESFHEVRGLLIETVKDRSRPLWHRLVLMGVLCHRLNEINAAEMDGRVPELLAEYREMLRSGWGRVELEGMLGQLEFRLSFVLAMTEERMRGGTCGARFRETYWSFVEGVGTTDEAVPGSDVRRFQEAEERTYRAYFDERPWVLENYLLNAMFQRLFPFGRREAKMLGRTIFEEYLLLVGQFCWVNGLLIGVAGRIGKSFSGDDVVRVVQSFSREVDHESSAEVFLLEWMKMKQVDSLQGIILLLKS